MTIFETFPSEAYADGRTVIARYDEFGRREYEVIGAAPEPLPERLPIAGYRPSHSRTVTDHIQVPQSATRAEVIICSRKIELCGWRSSYPVGTTHRGDGTSILDAA